MFFYYESYPQKFSTGKSENVDKSKKCFNKSDFCVSDVKSFPQVVKKSRRVVARLLKIAGDPQKDFYNKKNGALPHHGGEYRTKKF